MASAIAATILASSSARAQTIDLAEIARGDGGFLVRDEGPPAPRTGVGRSVSGAGDVNGDAIPDLIVDGSTGDPPDAYEHPVYVVFGKPDGQAVEVEAVERGEGGFTIRGCNSSPVLGHVVAGAGDVNGDGLADVLVRLSCALPDDRSDAGECYVVFGKTDGASVELTDIRMGRGGFAISGMRQGECCSGRSVAGAGDVNGDGLDDLLIGESYASPNGRFRAGEGYVIFGKRDGTLVEIAEIEVGGGGFAIRGVADLDLSGRSVSGAGDVNGDGLADLLIGAPFADPEGRKDAGESYVVFGKRDGSAVELADVQAGQGGFALHGIAADNESGTSVSGAGDVDGDGLADILIGAPGTSASPDSEWYAGESYVVFGKVNGQPVELLTIQSGLGGFAIRGIAERDCSGSSVSGAGDVNGDGLADLLIGAFRASNGAGESYVVFGKGGGALVRLSTIQAGQGGFAIRGIGPPSNQGIASGWSVSAAGDVSRDGLADLLIGAPLSQSWDRSGAGYVVFGKRDGATVELSDVGAGQGGFQIRSRFFSFSRVSSVSGVGDVDGDGLADFLIGAPSASPENRRQAGESYLVFGEAGGATIDLRLVHEGLGGFPIYGSTENDLSGQSLSGAGDVNGDSLPDFLIGAPKASPMSRKYAGEAYVVFGMPNAHKVDLRNVQLGEGGFAIRGIGEGDYCGTRVSSAGDVNGDGFPDLFIVAPGADPEGRASAGEGYVIFGKRDLEAVELGDIRAGQGGFAVQGSTEGSFGFDGAGAGDVNGDGFSDLLVARLGESYVVFGKPDGASVRLGDVQDGQGGIAIRGGDRIASASGAGDINGDGFADVLIGGRGHSDPPPYGMYVAGVSYAVFGTGRSAAVELADVEAGRGGFAIRGTGERDYSGTSVSGAGDVNGDGLADLLIGAPLASPDGGHVAGKCYVVFGKTDGELVELSDVQVGRGGIAIRGNTEGDQLGSIVSGAGDVSGDGFADILVGGGGAAYVVFGGGIGHPEAPRLLRGDPNADALVDISDPVRILGWLFVGAAEPECLAAADANGDASVDISDATYLLGFLFLGGPPPPAPFPACGESERSADRTLGCVESRCP